jgi:mRNA interferase RelE/StbE
VALEYTILTRPAARRQLAQLKKANNPDYPHLVAAIVSLAKYPRPLGCRKLANRPEWRIRVGNYRVLYLIDDPRRIITVAVVAHRRDVYR